MHIFIHGHQVRDELDSAISIRILMTTRNWDISFTSVCNDRSSSSTVVTSLWIGAMAVYWLRGECASSTTECALHIIQQEIWTATCYKTVLEMHETLYFWNLNLSQHGFLLDNCHVVWNSLKDQCWVSLSRIFILEYSNTSVIFLPGSKKTRMQSCIFFHCEILLKTLL